MEESSELAAKGEKLIEQISSLPVDGPEPEDETVAFSRILTSRKEDTFPELGFGPVFDDSSQIERIEPQITEADLKQDS